jgi:hypothetical protein
LAVPLVPEREILLAKAGAYARDRVEDQPEIADWIWQSG